MQWQPNPVFLPGESQGWQSLVGCRLWGGTELDTTEATQQQQQQQQQQYFLMAFLFVFFFWDSYDSNFGAFNIVPEVSEVVFISFNYLFFFRHCFIYFYNSIFYLTYPIFCLHYSTICCLQSVYLWFHFDFKILDHFHYGYSEFFLR